MKEPSDRSSRREFLEVAGVLPAVAALQPPTANAAGPQELPMVRFGKVPISRLVCGSNPFGGLSHISEFINREMRAFFTPEQVLKTCRRCTEVGINTFEPLRANIYEALQKEGIKVQGFLRGQGDPARVKQFAATPGVIGIHHYGVATDNWFKEGQFDVVRDYTKRIRDTGLLVGVAAHMPEAIAEAESQGWDVDYYMTCVYQWGRRQEEFEKLAGSHKDLLPIETYTVVTPQEKRSEVFLSGDPPKMFKVVKQVKKPCVVYKILAAGRRCETPQTVEAAFKEAFENIKPTDAVIVGFYDRYTDQPAENAELVRKYGATS
jgi:hypothetical protein